MILLLLAAQAAAPPGGDPPGWSDPPVEMIDFLGRRWECAHSDVPVAERLRLRCAALAGEERVWRTRFAADAAALRWLNAPPLAFRMERRFISRFDGPSPTRIHTIAQRGTDDNGRAYRLAIDSRADGGRSTRITVTHGGAAARSFSLSNRAFPLLDLHSLQVGGSEFRELPGLVVELTYGRPRPYCGDSDTRPRVTIAFEPGRVRGTDRRRDNCQLIYVEFRDAPSR